MATAIFFLRALVNAGHQAGIAGKTASIMEPVPVADLPIQDGGRQCPQSGRQFACAGRFKFAGALGQLPVNLQEDALDHCQ